MVTAIYPGTFDPITNGHLDIIERVSEIFDKVIVAVYETSPKPVLFTVEERMDLCSKSIEKFSNIEVSPFTGLAVSFAGQVGAIAMIRGLRAGSDFENEFDMAMMNKKLSHGMETVFLMSRLEWQFLSSSRIKEVVQLGADVSDMVPSHVFAALRTKLGLST